MWGNVNAKKYAEGALGIHYRGRFGHTIKHA